MWKVCWNKGRLCWKIAKLFYFCHLKKLVRPETSGPYYVYSHLHQTFIQLNAGKVSVLILVEWNDLLIWHCYLLYSCLRMQCCWIVTIFVLWMTLLTARLLHHDLIPWRNSPQWGRACPRQHSRHTTVGRTSMDDRSGSSRHRYLTTHNTHNIQTSMAQVQFEPTITANERRGHRDRP